MNVLEALEEGAKNTLAVAMACASAGIVIACVTITGLGIVFTQLVIALAQDTLILALILTAMAGIVLGMGMPTTPAYIMMAALLIPALIKLGIAGCPVPITPECKAAVVPAAHMFAFYFAILSAITPPVALAVFAAASLAKANMWQSGFAAMRAAAAYIVPFMFVYEPMLLLIVNDWGSAGRSWSGPSSRRPSASSASPRVSSDGSSPMASPGIACCSSSQRFASSSLITDAVGWRCSPLFARTTRGASARCDVASDLRYGSGNATS